MESTAEPPTESLGWRLGRRLRAVLRDRGLLACGVLALVVLLPGAGWGIPHATSAVTIRGWDVDGITGIGILSELSNLTSGSRDDWYVAYPLFHYLVLSAVYAPYLALLLLTGRLDAPGGDYPYGFSDPVGAIATLAGIGRAVSLLMACACVCCVFVMSRRAFGTRAAFFGAGTALLTAPFLFYARTGNLDIPVLFWILLTFVVVQRSWHDGLTPGRAVACGAFASLAVATKDQAYGLLVPVLALLAWRTLRQTTSHSGGGSGVRPVALLVGSGILSFAVAGGILVRPDRFLRHLRYITSFESTFANVRTANELTVLRPSTVEGYLSLLGDVGMSLATAVGWPALVIGATGLALAWRREPTARWLLAAAAGFFVLVIAPIHHSQYRYVVAPACFVAFGVAAAVDQLARLRLPAWASTGLGALAVFGALPGAAELTHAQRNDARWVASEWLESHVPAGDTVGFFGRPHQLPRMPKGVYVISLTESGEARANLARVRPTWLVVAPDYFSDAARERSAFLPADLYAQLSDGSLGWTRVQRFQTPPLLNRPLPYLPYVNPTVQVFQRGSPRTN